MENESNVATARALGLCINAAGTVWAVIETSTTDLRWDNCRVIAGGVWSQATARRVVDTMFELGPNATVACDVEPIATRHTRRAHRMRGWWEAAAEALGLPLTRVETETWREEQATRALTVHSTTVPQDVVIAALIAKIGARRRGLHAVSLCAKRHARTRVESLRPRHTDSRIEAWIRQVGPVTYSRLHRDLQLNGSRAQAALKRLLAAGRLETSKALVASIARTVYRVPLTDVTNGH